MSWPLDYSNGQLIFLKEIFVWMGAAVGDVIIRKILTAQ